MSDPNEYLRRLCASADLFTEHSQEYEGSGLKPHVDNTVDQIIADGLNLSVDSIAGFMMAVGLIANVDDELCKLDPIRRVSREVWAVALEPHTLATAVGAELARRFLAGVS